MEQEHDTAQAELERQRRRIADMEAHLAHLRKALDECRVRMSECRQRAASIVTPPTTTDTQMSYSSRATIDAIRARLERVEADMRETRERERAAAIQRLNQDRRAE